MLLAGALALMISLKGGCLFVVACSFLGAFNVMRQVSGVPRALGAQVFSKRGACCGGFMSPSDLFSARLPALSGKTQRPSKIRAFCIVEMRGVIWSRLCCFVLPLVAWELGMVLSACRFFDL